MFSFISLDRNPTSVVGCLQSFGKTSFYARYLASSGLAPNSDGSGGTVADGGAVGCWSPFEESSFNFKFIQATAGSRPAYGANRDGSPGVYGNASSWSLAMNSTSALNGSFTILISAWVSNESALLFSKNVTSVAVASAANAVEIFYLNGSQAPQGPMTTKKERISTGYRLRGGYTCNGTFHNGTAMHLFQWSSAFARSSSTIYEIVLCPSLTSEEIRQAINLLV